MKPWLARHAFTLLVIILLLAGAGFLVAGAYTLLQGDEQPLFVVFQPSSTPEPTATEPILPPPPTVAAAGKGPTDHATSALTAAAPEPLRTATAGAASVSSELTEAAATSAVSTPMVSLAPLNPTRSSAQTVAPTVPIPSTTNPPATSAPTTAATLAVATATVARPTEAPTSLRSLRQRLGVGASASRVTVDTAADLGFGWYLDWRAGPDRFHSKAVEYVPMIRLYSGSAQPQGPALEAAVAAMPGALWLIGNEPDVKWQDNVTPDRYAELYHDLYAQLKGLDPTCLVAIGGVTQPTPLRLRYLDRILDAYQKRYGEPLPVDVWNVHNFILREERDSWGVGIPPGMPDNSGELREIADHDNMVIFRQQIVDFRRWMAERGQRDKPLIVTEYGILMPNEYGFAPDRVERFMLDTFEFFRTAADPALGYPADGNRLVQRWCWFSLADARYPTGDLVVPDTGELTPLGKTFRDYAFASP